MPTKKRVNGKRQVISQAKFFPTFKSYRKTFFKVNPKAIKEVKVVKTPKKSPKLTKVGLKKFRKPVKADSVVWGPVIPNIK